MEKIFSDKEADGMYHRLTEQDKNRLNNDKIRFGEYFIGVENDEYHRVDPLNVVYNDGRLVDISENNNTQNLPII